MPTIAFWPTTTSLSRMERSTTAPDADDGVEHDDAVAHDGPESTRTPGDRMELTTVPAMTQPWLMRLRWTLAVGPTLAGARSSDRVWMTQSGRTGRARGSSSSSSIWVRQ